MVLTAVIFSPLLGALVVGLMPREPVAALRRGAFVVSLLPFLLSLWMLAAFDPSRGEFQLVEQAPWIGEWGITYLVGVDGISLFLVLLTTFLTPLVMLAAWGDIRVRVKEYFVFFLLLECGMVGAFLALDLFLFYIFWEVMLIPMYFLIGLWGGPRRVYAAIKFVLYTMLGSLLMLVAILYLVHVGAESLGAPTFDLRRLAELDVPLPAQAYLFGAFALAFSIKVPLFPFHTWLPDAHVEAPTGGSVILAGVLLKMGTYGFLRFAIPLFPRAAVAAAPGIAVLAVVGIVYGALVAMAQSDIKKLVAYSSVSHLGFVMLGLFTFNTPGVVGGIYQMLNHGLSTGALFLVVGVIYERRHTRELDEFGGLWAVMPRYAALVLVVVLSSIGLPGLNGFVGEFLILLGAFRWHRWLAVIATSGVVLGAAYMLWAYQRMMFGPVTVAENRRLADLGRRETVVLAPVLALIVFMGLYPRPFLTRMEPTVEALLKNLAGRGVVVAAAPEVPGEGPR